MTLREALVAACGASAVGIADGGGLRVRPPDPGSVARVVAACRDAGAPVALAGADAAPGDQGVALDLEGLDAIEVNAESHLVRVGAGVPVDSLERVLHEARLTLGWPELPASPLGALLAAGEPGPGGAAALPGWSPVVALEAVLLDGTPLETTVAPRSATGPDLKALLVGGQGRVGVITGATLRVHGLPQLLRRVVHAFPDYASAVAAAAECLGRDLLPDRFGVVDGGPEGEAHLTWERHGEARRVGLEATVVDEVCGAGGGRRVATEARTGLPRAGGGDGAAGPVEVRRAIPGDAEVLTALCRWSRLPVVRRALLEAVGDTARVHLARALPDGVVALLAVPAGRGDEAAEVARRAGCRLQGDPDAGPWLLDVADAVGGEDA